jgi:hypothetical protein
MDRDASPARMEDGGRIAEMEARIAGLERRIALSEEESRKAQAREQGVLGLLRDVLGYMAVAERGEPRSHQADDRICWLADGRKSVIRTHHAACPVSRSTAEWQQIYAFPVRFAQQRTIANDISYLLHRQPCTDTYNECFPSDRQWESIQRRQSGWLQKCRQANTG